MTRWLAAGWVDTFRVRHPGEAGHYTWWRQWGGARAKQCRLAHRLRARLAPRQQTNQPCIYLAQCWPARIIAPWVSISYNGPLGQTGMEA